MKICSMIVSLLLLVSALVGCADDKVQGGFPVGHVLYQPSQGAEHA